MFLVLAPSYALLLGRDQAIAKGVLQFASKSSLRDANALLSAYKVCVWQEGEGTC